MLQAVCVCVCLCTNMPIWTAAAVVAIGGEYECHHNEANAMSTNDAMHFLEMTIAGVYRSVPPPPLDHIRD